MDNTEQNCPICGNIKFRSVGRPITSPKVADFIKTDYIVLECEICHFYFVSPMVTFSKDEWEKLYDETYFGKMTKWWASRRERDRKDRLNRLERKANRKLINFLDVGCGEGYVLIEASKKGWKAHGIDISDNRVDLARKDGISFTKADIFEAKFSDHSFDCIYMDSVLEHVLDPISYLSELNRIMKKGGVLYLGVPNENSLFKDVRKFLLIMSGKRNISARINPFVSPYHISGFTKKSLMISALKSNFKVVEFKNFAGEYEFLKFRLFTKPFLFHLFLLPIYIIAIPTRKQTYLDAIFRK